MADIEKKNTAFPGGEEEKEASSADRIAFIRELDEIIKEQGLERGDVILAGSAVLALYGIRQNNDLEFALTGDKKKEFIKRNFGKMNPWSHRSVSENVDFFNNIYGIIGVSDEDLIRKGLFTEAGGYRIASLNLELAFKKRLSEMLKRDKDAADIIRIEEYAMKHGMDMTLPEGAEDGAGRFWFMICRQAGRAEDRMKKIFKRK